MCSSTGNAPKPQYSRTFAVIVTSVCCLLLAGRLARADGTDAARCQAIHRIDVSRVIDAPSVIDEAKPVEGTNDAPAYCQISGYVAPTFGFLIRLPRDHWNGKLVEIGCGGLCGSTDHIGKCDDPLSRGYACVVSDGGHHSRSSDANWAYNNVSAIIDYLVGASHVTALIAKTIVEDYYREAPKKSYFMGCSAGGEQAMMEAQRFPWDFDGIVAGQPTSETLDDMSLLWGNRILMGKGREPILNYADLQILHAAVVAKCDINDGIRDGLIGDPRTCDFDPSTLLCSSTKKTACLTSKQIEVARNLYAGPTTSRGKSISQSGAMRGSELTWLQVYGGSAEEALGTYHFAGEPFRYYTFQPSPGPSWKPEDFDFDRDYKRMGMAEGLISAINPDLRQFKAAGAKLLAYAGWSDALGLPMSAVDYYETAEKTMGGQAQTQDFFRLFMIPGMNHCTLGEGAFAVDYLSYLDAWVEKGQKPDKLIGSHVRLDGLDLKTSGASADIQRRLRFPLDREAVQFTRPIYPYPTLTQFSGHGDPNDAANFTAVDP